MVETTETIDTSETTKMLAPGEPELQLREHWNSRTIYFSGEVVDDIDIRFQDLNLEWRKRYGEDLPKNERFYPAVIRTALEETSIEAQLGLDDS